MRCLRFIVQIVSCVLLQIEPVEQQVAAFAGLFIPQSLCNHDQMAAGVCPVQQTLGLPRGQVAAVTEQEQRLARGGQGLKSGDAFLMHDLQAEVAQEQFGGQVGVAARLWGRAVLDDVFIGLQLAGQPDDQQTDQRSRFMASTPRQTARASRHTVRRGPRLRRSDARRPGGANAM